jgi:hypothetical protein
VDRGKDLAHGPARSGARDESAPERGLSLVEALASSLIAVITVIGLAYSFGTGRSLIDRYEVYRAATADAQLRLEQLVAQPSSTDLDIPSGTSSATHPATPNNFMFNGAVRGTENWTVAYLNDPADGTADADSLDLKQVTVMVRWTTNGQVDSVLVSRIYRLK